MRNLVEHPITTKEIEECCIKLSLNLAAEKHTGDMRPLLLQVAAKIINRVDLEDYDFFGIL